jgi:hypothetical protein
MKKFHGLSPERNMCRLKSDTIVEVRGWPMLARLEPGRYRIEVQQTKVSTVYAFFKPRGRVCIVRHLASNVDPWIRKQDSPDLNGIQVICGG